MVFFIKRPGAVTEPIIDKYLALSEPIVPAAAISRRRSAGKARFGSSRIPVWSNASLLETHRSDAFDHTGIRQDPNLAFPADRLREMASAGIIGSLNHRYLSIMGSVTAPGRLIKRTIPQVVPRLVEDQVDAALLIPV